MDNDLGDKKIFSKRPISNKKNIEIFLESDFCISDDEIEDITPHNMFEQMRRRLEDGENERNLIDDLIYAIRFFQNLKREITTKKELKEQISSVSQHNNTKTKSLVQKHYLQRSVASSSSHITESRSMGCLNMNHPNKTKRINKPVGNEHCMIWNSVNRFFGKYPGEQIKDKFLKDVEFTQEIEPLGPHYSLGYNLKLKQKFKIDQNLLKIPDSIINASSGANKKDTLMFYRILSVLMPTNKITVDQVENILKQTTSTEFDTFIGNGNFTPSLLYGTSPYSRLSFSEKLCMEIESLGLRPHDCEQWQSDNEVYIEIIKLNKLYKESLEKTNPVRKRICKLLSENDDELRMRRDKVPEWEGLIERAKKIERAKIEKKPKSRKKTKVNSNDG